MASREAAASSWLIGMRTRSLTILLVAAIAFVLGPLILRSPLTRHVMVIAVLFAILGQAWNIVGGYAGQMSLGQALFFGIGAYISSVLLLQMSLSPWIGMFVGGIGAAIIAGILGLALFRLSGHYFAIATLALPIIAQSVFISSGIAQGAVGLRLPYAQNDLFGAMLFTTKVPYYYVCLGLLAAIVAVTRLIETSRLGYYLRAIRNDETATRSLGINVVHFKLIAFGISGFFTAMAGSVYAQYLLFIDPDSVFSIVISVLAMLVAVLGGAGTLWGPLLGAIILIPLSEGTKVLLGSQGLGIDALLYAALIIVIAIVRPEGLLGKRNLRLTR